MQAARTTDPTVHGGTIADGCPTVLIGNLPSARLGDYHVCPMIEAGVPHVGGPIIQGSPTVLIGGLPAARATDLCLCVGPPDPGSAASEESAGSPVEDAVDGRVSARRPPVYHDEERAEMQVGQNVFTAEEEVDVGVVDAEGRVHADREGYSVEGQAEAISVRQRGNLRLGSRENPVAEVGETITGPSASASGRADGTWGSTTPNVADGSASAGLGSVAVHGRATSPTVLGRNIQVSDEASGGWGGGGTLGGGVWHDDEEGRWHMRIRADSSGILALVTFGLKPLLPSPWIGTDLQISFGRPYPESDGDSTSPRARAFSAGPDMIASGEATVLIGP